MSYDPTDTLTLRVARLLYEGTQEFTPQELRDNDVKLLIAYWRSYGIHVPSEFYQELEEKVPAKPDSLQKARASVQNSLGLFPASNEVKTKRHITSHKIENEYVSLKNRGYKERMRAKVINHLNLNGKL